jgi:hypothetical protein
LHWPISFDVPASEASRECVRPAWCAFPVLGLAHERLFDDDKFIGYLSSNPIFLISRNATQSRINERYEHCLEASIWRSLSAKVVFAYLEVGVWCQLLCFGYRGSGDCHGKLNSWSRSRLNSGAFFLHQRRLCGDKGPISSVSALLETLA